MMSTAECANDYIWYTIQSEHSEGSDTTFSILPEDKSIKIYLTEVPTMHIPIAMDAIRVNCIGEYNRPVAFKIGHIEYT